MTDSKNQYRFFSYVRYGLAAAIPYSDQPPAIAQLPLSVLVDDKEAQIPSVRFYGPGDITGVSQAQIKRVEPVHLATNFPPNRFPSVEFRRADFPWLFTPTGPKDARLTPWLSLVVVRRQPGVSIEFSPTAPLPVLKVQSPVDARDEVFDLSEAWAWAHVQVEGTMDGQAGRDALAAQNAISRIICPRRLEPDTDYYACLVPTFLSGKEIGTGREPRNPRLDLAHTYTWGAELPVYYHWEFRTGPGGDFRSLALKLKPGALPEGFGTRPASMDHPGYGLVGPGAPLRLEGVLQPPGAQPTAWPDEVRLPFQQALLALLNTPDTLTEPVVAPPVYGRWHAGAGALPGPGQQPAWLVDLNLDPRYRAIAGLGTRVVQEDQEKLMAQAWDQLREAREINRRLSVAQLAKATGESIRDKRLSPLPLDRLLPVSRPVHRDLKVPARPTGDANKAGFARFAAPSTLESQLRASIIPDAVLSLAFERIARPRGPLGRRLLGRATRSEFSVVTPINQEKITPAPDRKAPDGTVTLDGVTDHLGAQYSTIRFENATPELIRDAQGWDDPAPEPTPEQPPQQPGETPNSSEIVSSIKDDVNRVLGQVKTQSEAMGTTVQPMMMRERRIDDDASVPDRPRPRPYPKAPPIPNRDAADRIAMERNFRAAAAQHQEYLLKVNQMINPPKPPSLPTDQLPDMMLVQLDPASTLVERAQEQLKDAPPETWVRTEPLAPLQFTPHFDQPMYEPLRRVAPELMLPGLDQITADTITAVELNPRFVEAYMAGLNHEMSRELLWREFPAPLGATFFQRFWSTAADPDISPIHTWSPAARLGDICGPGVSGKVLLLLRGALLHRYPEADIFALPAVAQQTATHRAPGPDSGRRNPFLRAKLAQDMALIGFDLPVAEAKGDATNPGWYLIIQNQPESIGFGIPPGLEKPTEDPAETRKRTHLWQTELKAANAADAAEKTLIKPVRYARHFDTILAAGTTFDADERAGD